MNRTVLKFVSILLVICVLSVGGLAQAHPGAEHGAMRGSLMLGMMPGMFDRLRLSQSADGKDTEHEEDRHEFEDDAVHQKTTQCDLAEC